MIVHVDPRFYPSVAARYEKAPVFNIDLLMALYQTPQRDRDVYADDEGVLILECGEGESTTAILDTTSSDGAKGLIEVLDEDEYRFIVRERWLTMFLEASWEIDFQEPAMRRYSTDPNHFSGTPEHEVLEITAKQEDMVLRFKEERDDFKENPPLWDLLGWQQKGRTSRIFAAIEKKEIAAYVYAMPICAELGEIWRLPFIYALPEARGRGLSISALCHASRMLLEDDKRPVITPWSEKTVEACEAIGYTIADNRLMGVGTRIKA